MAPSDGSEVITIIKLQQIPACRMASDDAVNRDTNKSHIQ
jgi:hypothetical protein